MPSVGAVHRHMHSGADPVTGMPVHPDLLHQLVVAHANRPAVHHRAHAASGDTAAVDRLAVGFPERAGHRMVGIAFRQRGDFQQLCLGNRIRMNCGDVEHPFGQGAGFIENHRFHPRECFQVVAAFYQYARF